MAAPVGEQEPMLDYNLTQEDLDTPMMKDTHYKVGDHITLKSYQWRVRQPLVKPLDALTEAELIERVHGLHWWMLPCLDELKELYWRDPSFGYTDEVLKREAAQHAASFDSPAKRGHRFCLLSNAVRAGNTRLAQWLWDQHKRFKFTEPYVHDTITKQKHSLDQLCLAAVKSGSIAMCQWLREKGLGSRDILGIALRLADKPCSHAILQWLLEVNQEDLNTNGIVLRTLYPFPTRAEWLYRFISLGLYHKPEHVLLDKPDPQCDALVALERMDVPPAACWLHYAICNGNATYTMRCLHFYPDLTHVLERKYKFHRNAEVAELLLPHIVELPTWIKIKVVQTLGMRAAQLLQGAPQVPEKKFKLILASSGNTECLDLLKQLEPKLTLCGVFSKGVEIFADTLKWIVQEAVPLRGDEDDTSILSHNIASAFEAHPEILDDAIKRMYRPVHDVDLCTNLKINGQSRRALAICQAFGWLRDVPFLHQAVALRDAEMLHYAIANGESCSHTLSLLMVTNEMSSLRWLKEQGIEATEAEVRMLLFRPTMFQRAYEFGWPITSAIANEAKATNSFFLLRWLAKLSIYPDDADAEAMDSSP